MIYKKNIFYSFYIWLYVINFLFAFISLWLFFLVVYEIYFIPRFSNIKNLIDRIEKKEYELHSNWTGSMVKRGFGNNYYYNVACRNYEFLKSESFWEKVWFEWFCSYIGAQYLPKISFGYIKDFINIKQPRENHKISYFWNLDKQYYIGNWNKFYYELYFNGYISELNQPKIFQKYSSYKLKKLNQLDIYFYNYWGSYSKHYDIDWTDIEIYSNWSILKSSYWEERCKQGKVFSYVLDFDWTNLEEIDKNIFFNKIVDIIKYTVFTTVIVIASLMYILLEIRTKYPIVDFYIWDFFGLD